MEQLIEDKKKTKYETKFKLKMHERENHAMTGKVDIQIESSEMKFLRRVTGCTLFNRICTNDITLTKIP